LTFDSKKAENLRKM